MKRIDGGVTAARGFKASSTAAGLKYINRDDMALIYSESPCVCAGTFTTNVVKAAPVIWDRNIVESGNTVNAIVINSGIANACTGKPGMDTCALEAKEVAAGLGIEPSEVLVCSTGVIGAGMPQDKLQNGIKALCPKLSDSLEAGTAAERAIMTTDTRPKEVAFSFEIGGKTVRIGGMCKGSGMIHPNMCTMLAFITTDVAISKQMLTKALREDVPDSFNMVSIDGDTSTNDTALVLANGQAGNPLIDCPGADYETFAKALHAVTVFLSKRIAEDGEGATALFACRVTGADTKENARILAKSVICSSLTKAMIFGHDCNFGRILCALGYSSVSFDPDNVDLYFEGGGKTIHIYGGGQALAYSEEEATALLSQPEVTAVVDMHMGCCGAEAWGCDLSFDYVKINADYRS